MRQRDPHLVLLEGFGGRLLLSEEAYHGIRKTP
jgi:hypothetical protein